jgi:hypothetical protein
MWSQAITAPQKQLIDRNVCPHASSNGPLTEANGVLSARQSSNARLIIAPRPDQSRTGPVKMA